MNEASNSEASSNGSLQNSFQQKTESNKHALNQSSTKYLNKKQAILFK